MRPFEKRPFSAATLGRSQGVLGVRLLHHQSVFGTENSIDLRRRGRLRHRVHLPLHRLEGGLGSEVGDTRLLASTSTGEGVGRLGPIRIQILVVQHERNLLLVVHALVLQNSFGVEVGIITTVARTESLLELALLHNLLL